VIFVSRIIIAKVGGRTNAPTSDQRRSSIFLSIIMILWTCICEFIRYYLLRTLNQKEGGARLGILGGHGGG